ncbi:4-hydroxybenzoate 3-monooxygenase [Ponticoccus sp. SC2-23]|uniref:4-hydroxybenzoate 3-monooxygenase n=1 Tax=Alexandriicola marinus TaxID=2081710 RepID=UPI000FDB0ED8|nr:4-hydroxybenzoate 3-monooxygenase [Alexandriicola marinus]MBM1221794.1 4-hydroxybenzoate 3-monooxygenase [Ponticoccus sp. SC6-9]MBM1226145.1 4-hydroxybenzoate 3-monooxygenase [Ponticoccus sp. SC6-15]MBM1230741.1 4-hydroxybenzoate 3-monooxygenase [Ponticoccus sp. SC6-38]MBM1235418.1 4-hydroxybenzoate 3-monooxygenase [Ponticoccus sp. SC6-45]MBM1239763.1 4-hydroxybenzoate 3-monooxygenase [Ponticoccus sp. SC6-49]MBM1243907.1 4-hydroxybenzoate 3-monooxygenase [Ponticoccus sp. SC2-64]MBM1248942
MKTDVVIIGGGPSGLLLSQLLNKAGVETIILERSSREHVLSRIRAGVLEWGTVDLLQEAGVDERLRREGIPHDGCYLADEDQMIHIDFHGLTNKRSMVYGQTEVTKDLYAAQDRQGTPILHGVEDVVINDPKSDAPYVTCILDGTPTRIDCRYVAGCDGFHGVSRKTIPETVREEFERVYPFGWLGILSETPPANDELIYCHSDRGFALCSMRNENLSRYYIQVPLTDKPENWSDDEFWAELKRRMPAQSVETLVTGPSIEKSIAPLRSFVTEPMSWGRLFLVGDAAHIVPPTGAKGLNLAASDVFYLKEGLIDAIVNGDSTKLDAYSDRALARIWKAMRFSWEMTTMLHQFDGEDSFAPQMRKATLDHLARSESARRDLAENYIGLPY